MINLSRFELKIVGRAGIGSFTANLNIASHKFISVNVRNRSTISPIGNLLKGVPQQFSLPGLPCVTSLQSPTPVVTLLTKAICSLHWLPCIPWQMITMLFSSTMSNDSYDKGGRASNDSLLTVRTLYHYAGNLLKGAPQEFSLPGLPSVTSLQNVNEMLTLVTKLIYRLPWLPRVPW